MFWGAKPVVNDIGGMFLKSSAETCANNGVPVPKEKELTPVESALAWISFITAQNLLLVLCFVLLWYMYRFKSNKTARKKKIELAKKCMDEGKMDDAEKLLNTIKPKTNWNTAMLFHPDISPAVRYGVVFIQCCLFILFLWANLNPGASVDLYLKIANDPIVIEDLFLFTLGGTISDMLNAGVYALAIIIILFSYVTPREQSGREERASAPRNGARAGRQHIFYSFTALFAAPSSPPPPPQRLLPVLQGGDPVVLLVHAYGLAAA